MPAKQLEASSESSQRQKAAELEAQKHAKKLKWLEMANMSVTEAYIKIAADRKKTSKSQKTEQ